MGVFNLIGANYLSNSYPVLLKMHILFDTNYICALK